MGMDAMFSAWATRNAETDWQIDKASFYEGWRASHKRVDERDAEIERLREEVRDHLTWKKEIPVGAGLTDRKHGETLGFYARRMKQVAERALRAAERGEAKED